MINVDIVPFGRQLLTAVFGAVTYQANVRAKNMAVMENEMKQISAYQKETDMWNEITFDMTTKLIDKRYNASKEFVQSGSGQPTFKKTVGQDDKRFLYIAQQNLLKSRTRYQSAVSQQNKRLADQKVKATFKLSDLKKIM